MNHPVLYDISENNENAMLTLVLGDLHGDFEALNIFLASTPAHTLLVCGDFGFWPSFGKNVSDIRNRTHGHRIAIRFCDGNHEEHPCLRQLIHPAAPHEAVEVADGIFYQPRGSVWTAPRGERVFFAGGAYSTDNALREIDKDWFHELEILTRSDLPPVLPPMDVVISHTAPTSFPIERAVAGSALSGTDRPDPSRNVLDVVLKEGKPARWFFGHFHKTESGLTQGCRWQCLPPCHDKRPLAVKRSGIPNIVQTARL